jgi:hypothetical protein
MIVFVFHLLITSSCSEVQHINLTQRLFFKNSGLLPCDHHKKTGYTKHKVPVGSKHAGGIIKSNKDKQIVYPDNIFSMSQHTKIYSIC